MLLYSTCWFQFPLNKKITYIKRVNMFSFIRKSTNLVSLKRKAHIFEAMAICCQMWSTVLPFPSNRWANPVSQMRFHSNVSSYKTVFSSSTLSLPYVGIIFSFKRKFQLLFRKIGFSFFNRKFQVSVLGHHSRQGT